MGVIGSLIWGRVKSFIWGYILGAATGGVLLAQSLPTIEAAIRRWLGYL